MDNNHLIQEAKQHFNEPILIMLDLCRCVGYAEDDADCYLLVRWPSMGLTEGGTITRHTFVGGYTYLDRLKGQNSVTSRDGEEWDDFTRLDTLLEINGAPKEKEFICRIEGSRT